MVVPSVAQFPIALLSPSRVLATGQRLTISHIPGLRGAAEKRENVKQQFCPLFLVAVCSTETTQLGGEGCGGGGGGGAGVFSHVEGQKVGTDR